MVGTADHTLVRKVEVSAGIADRFNNSFVASVASFPFDRYPQACRSGDRRNDANGEPFPFQNRALLDVQLDEAIVVSGRDAHVGKISYESGFAADLLQCLAALIAKRLIDG